MRIQMLGQIMELENRLDSAEEMVRLIDEIVAKQELLYSHAVVDGQEIYDDLNDYLIEHIGDIDSIEIVFRTLKEYVGEVLISSDRYLSRAIPELRFLVDACYKGLNEESWGQLGQFLEGLQWINQVLAEIKQGRFLVDQAAPYIVLYNRLGDILPQLAAAIEQSDSILIGDTLSYEIVPLMESMQTEIRTTIDNEVPRHDLN